MWREGRLVPGESKLRLAENKMMATETEGAAEMTGGQADERGTAVVEAEGASGGALPINGSDIQMPVRIDVKGLLVKAQEYLTVNNCFIKSHIGHPIYKRDDAWQGSFV
jgi:hypothetical protein